MASTYTPIATTTLGSSATSYTFSSIPQTYKDLVLIIFASTNHTDNGARGYIQFNTDTGSSNNNYSDTWVGGNGSSATSSRDTLQDFIAYGVLGNSSTNFTIQIVNIQNYSNSTTYKTTLSRSSNPSTAGNNGLRATVGLWRNTATVNTLTLKCDSSYLSGSTFTLYGIQSA
jgi:hypothetical protein